MSGKVFKLTVPIPPSGNHRNGVSAKNNGRVRYFPKPKYTQYIEDVRAIFLSKVGTIPKPTDRPIGVTLVVYLKDFKAFDLDNAEKTLFDTLAKVGVYRDDKQIRWKSSGYGAIDKKNPRIEVSLTMFTGDRLVDGPVIQSMVTDMVMRME